jgi:hypothetical protein
MESIVGSTLYVIKTRVHIFVLIVDVISLEFVMKMAERTIYAGHSAISLQ